MTTVWDQFRSPCCKQPLEVSSSMLSCRSCRHSYGIETYGPDLMPPSISTRYQSYAAWQAVQEALASWRKRTWDGSNQAKEQTRASEAMGEEFIARLAPAGRILDIGCGAGWIAKLYQALCCEYAGVDPQPAQSVYPFPFARAVSDCLPFPNNAFDACVFYSSIDYSLAIDETLSEVYRVLRPGGKLGIATPVHRTKEVTGERLHHYRFLSGELEQLLGACFGTHPETFWHQENFAFIYARKPLLDAQSHARQGI